MRERNQSGGVEEAAGVRKEEGNVCVCVRERVVQKKNRPRECLMEGEEKVGEVCMCVCVERASGETRD